MGSIGLQNVCKSFEAGKPVIDQLNLTIEDGLFTVLVGASGCGKTTLLRMIAGIETQTSGSISIDEEDVSIIPPGKRGVAMVFQNYALYPTMTVYQNIEFGLKNIGMKRAERRKAVESICETVGLNEMLDRKPGTLSGGQRQRVALARAMVKQPKVFLMDEPLSNLDAKLRAQMRVELIELHRSLKATFVYVTHDQIEAMSMADRIVLMDKGQIMQYSTPEVIYRDPDNLFTAKFIGTPPMNSFECNQGIIFGFRPEHAQISLEPEPDTFSEQGQVVTREMLGAETIYQVRCPSGRSYMLRTPDSSYSVESKVYTNVPWKHSYFFSKDGNRIREGDTLYPACTQIWKELQNVV